MSPVYQFECNDHLLERVYSMSDVPDYAFCKDHHKLCKRIPFPERLHVSTGKRSRVYHQWVGNPDECPPDLRRALAKQDMPRDKSFYKSEEERYGADEAERRRKTIEDGKKRRKDAGVRNI